MILAQQYFCLQQALVVLIGTRIEQFRWTLDIAFWTLDTPEKIAFVPPPQLIFRFWIKFFERWKNPRPILSTGFIHI